ncbi:MAG: GIY-YIG nuclease family protein [Candidatus Saganbacteria bacterium]|nr:GIY-YIG nuclease family protein [Candidatus Saganbacteria bacterium]
MKYLVYILRSQKDGKLYVGQTANLEDRIKRHNEGRVMSTKMRRPLELMHYEEFEDRGSAIKRESYFKSLKNPQYLLDSVMAPSSNG